MVRDSILFYRSFYEAIKVLPKDIQVEIYSAVMEYGLNGNLPENLKPVAKGMFALMKPVIDNNNVRFENGKKGAEYGKRGGRPSKQKPAPDQPAHSLTFEQEIEMMKTDEEWSAPLCKEYSLSHSEYFEHLDRFLEHCRKNRNGKLHDSYDDAKSHLRYWLDKGGRRIKQSNPNNAVGNTPPDYDFNGGFGGKDT